MARTPITADQWEHARAMWEGDDRVSFANVGESLGISKQAVAKRAKAEGWKKRMDRQKVVEKAHRAADRAMAGNDLPLASLAVSGGNGAPEVDARPGKKTDAPHIQAEPVDETAMEGMSAVERAEHLAIQQRTAILTRHRNEVNALRTNLYTSIKDKDFALGKCAKINSEAMQIIHMMERKAWGIESDKPAEQGVVILERG